MKLTTASLTLLAALAAFPAPAAALTPVLASAQAETPNLRARLNNAIEELQKKAVARGATREDYQRVADQITAAAKEFEPQTPALPGMRARATARIEDIETRARAGAVDAAEFDVLRDHLIDMELEIALGRLKAAALAGKFTRAEYQGFLDAWTARATAAKVGNAELAAITTRAKTALEAIEKRAKDAAKPMTEADVVPLVDLTAEYRTTFWVAVLEEKALGSKKATKADYDDVTSAVTASSGEEIAKKVAVRLEELRKAAEGGRITREQFTELKTMLLTRARAASSGK